MRAPKYVIGLLLSLALSCTNADALPETTGPGAPTAEGVAAAEPVPAERASSETQNGVPTEGSGVATRAQESRYPALMFDLLDAPEQATFSRLAESELCPCEGTVASLDTCLRSLETSCELALQGAVIMMRMIKEGSDEVEITDAVQSHIANARRIHEFDLEGVPWRGAETPAVTLVCFSDFECPHCREFAETLHTVEQTYPDTVRIYHKQFPLGQHRNALVGALAALAAHRQGQFSAFHDALFARQAELRAAEDPRPLMLAVGESIGLNMERFLTDLQDPTLRTELDRDHAEGVAAGMMSTPTLFFDGVMVQGGYELEALSGRIDARLAARTAE